MNTKKYISILQHMNHKVSCSVLVLKIYSWKYDLLRMLKGLWF